MYTLLCEDSIAGAFTAIYEAWAGRYNRDEVVVKAGDIGNYELFMEYRRVDTDIRHSARVADSLQRRFGEKTFEAICFALWSSGEDKADAVYRMVRCGIEYKLGAKISDHLTEPAVQRVFELQRAAFNEYDHLRGFLRFVQLQNNILFATITPKHDPLEPLAAHFSDRLPMENWIIYDDVRRKAALHRMNGEWMIVGHDIVMPLISQEWARNEEDFRHMWRCFLNAVAIEERENLALQKQNLPLRFRGNMI